MKQTQIQYPAAIEHETSSANPTSQATPKVAKPASVKRGERKSIRLRDGEIVLFKRDHSAKWQARYKLFDGRWHRVATRHINREYAEKVACAAYDEARFRERVGLPQTTRRFDAIAKVVIAEMREELDKGAGKSIYKHYIHVLERFLVPFLGRHWITTIDGAALKEYETWRNKEMGKVPKASTMRTHASALSRVFEVAVQKGWLSDRHLVPRLNTRGERSLARPAFTSSEIEELLVFMPQWIAEKARPKATAMRELMRDYVEVLLYTGMRHGTESMNLKWQHIDTYRAAGLDQPYIRIWVSGKTGPRSLIAKHTIVPVLERMRDRFEELRDGTLEEALQLKNGDWLFRLRNGYRPGCFNGTFSRLMVASKLLENSAGARRTLYSFRHTYATLELLGGTDIHTVARQMGTSVAMLEKHYSKLIPALRAGVLA